MKKRRKGFIHQYWKNGRQRSVDDGIKKEEIASQRAKLLEKIREKSKKRERKVEVESFVEKPVDVKDDTVEDLSRKLGFDVLEDISTVDRERGVGKKELTKEEVEGRRRKSLEDKEKLSSKDILNKKIKELEDQIAKTKYNKRTQHAVGLMKAQLAGLKQKLHSGSGKKGSLDDGYSVRKSGDATVVLLGFPSTGKSTLLNNITNAQSETGSYAFTTLTVIPGMLEYKQAKIQILDVPGIVEGASKGTGRGKEVLQVIRTADLILMLIDALKPQQKKILEKEVYDTNIRLNQKKPDIKITKTAKDGILIGRTVLTPELDDDTIKAVLNQTRTMNATVLIREDVNADQFIDVVEGNKVYIPGVVVVNKIDLLSDEQRKKLVEYLNPDLCISAEKKEHLSQLKDIIFEKLDFIRLYMKEVNKKPDMDEPLIMKKGDTLNDVCSRLHKDFVEKFKFARIWGSSVKFPGQKVLKLDHELADGDVIELHIK